MDQLLEFRGELRQGDCAAASQGDEDHVEWRQWVRREVPEGLEQQTAESVPVDGSLGVAPAYGAAQAVAASLHPRSGHE